MARYKCSMCSSTTMVRLVWGNKAVCPACYFHERNVLDKLAFGESVEICRDKGICVYCGERATDKEHVIPRCSGLPTWIVPACSECNGLASGTVYDGLISKKQAIQAKLRRRHARALRVPHWDQEELSELGRTLRVAVEAYQRAKSVVECRVTWVLPGEMTQSDDAAA